MDIFSLIAIFLFIYFVSEITDSDKKTDDDDKPVDEFDTINVIDDDDSADVDDSNKFSLREFFEFAKQSIDKSETVTQLDIDTIESLITQCRILINQSDLRNRKLTALLSSDKAHHDEIMMRLNETNHVYRDQLALSIEMSRYCVSLYDRMPKLSDSNSGTIQINK